MIDALFDLLGTFYRNGDLVLAECLARSILAAIPDDPVSLQLLGLVYYRTRRRRQAVEAFAAADLDDRLFGQTVGTPAGGLPQASSQCLAAASTRGSPLAVAWYDLGLVLFRERRYTQALASLRAALAAEPEWSRARRAIARIERFSRKSRSQQPAERRTVAPRSAASSGEV
ncbi:tetratricopeptide repeat protein [Accumulibacter sp.]|uniref:tetratricopeptide repeat protein n=1 Tax=Accumulibacter sp. TaxID=2053492 RepID=UPI0025DE6EE1|nr:tetratricopeptide repeat protein [Accumulibacter sp.]MCM8594958.1 tetratricopeptide repeat protein [Accumulibacter sp.]MCM8624355.1 tetratricopeptide repeat protein [Accumulibacter sp.]MDS4049104.1 tetratricopeptide repeat protein [Accumulibacter sp.]